MRIEGKEIIADEGCLIRRIGQGTGFKRCMLLPNETEKDFEEAASFEEEIIEKPSTEQQYASFAKMMVATKTDFTDAQALSIPDLFDTWQEWIDKEVQKGMVLQYSNKLWRVRQTHTVQSIYPPSLDTASLYGVVNRENTGTIDDPIPYTPPMEIFAEKYYTQNGVKYKCTRNSEQELTHDLSALVGLYVEIV